MADTVQSAPMHARSTPMFERSHAVREYHRTIPAGISLETVILPEMWSQHAERLRPGDIVTVGTEDHAWIATLYVRASVSRSVTFAVLSATKLAPDMDGDVAGYKVGWGGPHHKHRVIRVSDNTVLRHGFDTPEAADAWLKDHVATVKAA